ncbi:MAG TPA: esterase [Flavobacteriaceae bacterium]|jgi:predicted esterase|nr:esterase [Flavobacteriaceae bacterium]HBS11519.1 esterase [Flavobacteriaceae bacterium]
MKSTEKEISYQSTNSYSTLNNLTDTTKNVWFVCHGIGYLSRYFLKYFKDLNPEENYIIALQAQSKYYLGSKYRHVGASWLTKENTAKETENVMHYFDAVLEAEKLPKDINLIVLGYSQGVSVATRYVASRKLKCSQLLLLSGGIPAELTNDDFKFLEGKTKVTLLYGDKDEYLTEPFMDNAIKGFYQLFGETAEINVFEGKHEVKKELLKQFC